MMNTVILITMESDLYSRLTAINNAAFIKNMYKSKQWAGFWVNVCTYGYIKEIVTLTYSFYTSLNPVFDLQKT